MLSMPSTIIQPGKPIPGWTISLSNKHRQHASIESPEKDDLPCLVMKSDGSEMRLSSQDFSAEPDMKFQIEALFKPGQNFKGDIWIGIELTRRAADGEQKNHLYQKSPASSRKNGWASAKGTFTLPAGSKSIRFEIFGKFKGRTLIKNIQLKRKANSSPEEDAPASR